MKIAITYDLRSEYLNQGYSAEETAEFDSIETITAIADVLQNLGCETENIGNIQHLVTALAQGKRWDLVFNIAEGLHGTSREGQVPSILDAYRIPYTFSDATTLVTTLDKSLAKHILRDSGIPTASFMVVRHLHDLEHFALAFPVFAKPLAEGTSKGITAASRIETWQELQERCDFLLRTYKQPALIEAFLSGREFTVGIFGNGEEAKVAGVMEVIFLNQAEANAYSYANKEFYEGRMAYHLAFDDEAKRAGEIALHAYHTLQCRDAARIDVRSDQFGNPQFIEANPIAGLHPVRSDLVILMQFLGIDYQACIEKILFAACKRIGLSLPSKHSKEITSDLSYSKEGSL